MTKEKTKTIENDYSNFRIKPIEIRHDQELHTNLEEITQVINKITTDVKQRKYALVRLGGILLGNRGHHQFVIKRLNNILATCIIKQITDFQTSLVTLGCRIIIIATKEIGSLIESGLEKMLSSSALFHLVPSANQIISDTSANTIYQIVKKVQTGRIIEKICAQSLSRNSKVKFCCAQELQYIIFNFNITTIMQNQQIIENALRALLSDILPTVNEIAREVYYTYLNKYENQAKVLFNLLDKHVKVAINNHQLKKSYKLMTVPESVVLSQGYKEVNLHSSGVIVNVLKNDIANASDKAFDNNCDEDNEGISSIIIRNKNQKYIEKEQEKVAQNKATLLKNINSKLDELELISSGSSALFQTKKEFTERFINEQIMLSKNTKTIVEKMSVFEAIDKKFNEIYSIVKLLNISLLEQLIDIHIESLTHSNINLLKQVLKNLSSFIFYMGTIINDKSTNFIVKLTVTHLSSGNQAIIKPCKHLLKIIEQKLDSNSVIRAFYELLFYEDCDEEACYHSMVSVIDYCRSTLEDPSFYNSLFLKLCRSLPESPSLIKIIDKLYRKHQPMFLESFSLASYDDKKLLKYILEFHNSYLLKHLSFDFITVGKVIQCYNSSLHNANQPNKVSPEDMLSAEITEFIKERDMEGFIDYALNQDNEQIRKFLLNLIMFPKEELGVILMFFYGLLCRDHSTVIINDNLRLVVDSLVYILINHRENIDRVREILHLLPFQIKSNNYFGNISKYITSGNEDFVVSLLIASIRNYIKVNKDNKLLELLPTFFHSMANMLNHPSPELRKEAANLLVDIYLLLGVKFEPFMNEMTKPQQNLLSIFIKKRQGIQ